MTTACLRPEPPEVLQLLTSSRRVATACGAGELVWHLWGRPGERPPLVMLHGGSGSWTHWLRNIETLVAADRWLLLPDLPGMGDSALPPAGRDADAMPEPLEQGLHRLVGDAVCEVIGFSFGAMVAGLWAQAFAQRFSRLVLLAPPGLGRPALEAMEPQGWRHLREPDERLQVHAHNLRELMFYRPQTATALASRIQQLNAERDRLPRRRLSRTDVLARALAHQHRPVHLIHGEHDRYYLHQTAEIEAVLRTCPGFVRRHAVADAGHWVQYEQAQSLHLALAQALDDPRVGRK